MTLQSCIMFPNSVYLYFKLFRLLALQIIPHSLYPSTLNILVLTSHSSKIERTKT